MDDISVTLRRWRRANGLKQGTLANLLGVSQAAVSRWETGLDKPSAQMTKKLQDLINTRDFSHLRIERAMISQMPGLRALVDLDGMRLLATSPTFKAIWPELGAVEGTRLADHLINLPSDLYHNRDLQKSIRRNEIAMISAVSDRHLNGYGDNAFRHYWAATYRKVGTRYLSEVSFEACEPDAELGVRQVLRIDEVA